MAEPQRDLKKLRAEQEKDDADILDDLERESKAFDKVSRLPFTRCRNPLSMELTRCYRTPKLSAS
jgi:hypothetical protein